ncbi:MAG: hypothetical protein U5M23_16535 [Marinagarivorans sp.]|nr:hypothetical protein [Marinagarivorans sp.]
MKKYPLTVFALTTKARQMGIGLIELMIALLLGIILIGAVIQALLSNMQTFNTNAGLARMQESARFASNELTRDIRMTGFKGCDALVENNKVLNLTGLADYNLAVTLKGEENVSPSTLAATAITNTDVIKATQMVDASAYLTANLPSNSTAITATLNDTSNFAINDIVFIGDCDKGVVAKVTATDASNKTLTLANTTGTANNTFDKGALVLKIETKTYYVAPTTYVNNAGVAINALWAKTNGSGPKIVALGVNDLQVLYGINNANSLAPDQFFVASNTLAFDKATVVRFKLGLSSLDNINGGGLLTREFTTSVTLRNRMIGGL